MTNDTPASIDEIINDYCIRCEDETDAEWSDRQIEAANALRRHIAAEVTKARIDELKQWTDVDTVPGIPINHQAELERMFDGMREGIAELQGTEE